MIDINHRLKCLVWNTCCSKKWYLHVHFTCNLKIYMFHTVQSESVPHCWQKNPLIHSKISDIYRNYCQRYWQSIQKNCNTYTVQLTAYTDKCWAFKRLSIKCWGFIGGRTSWADDQFYYPHLYRWSAIE
jgi:hypothetical protein